jgi:flavin-dependent dehydrogenase
LNTVDWIRRFKNKIDFRLDKRDYWLASQIRREVKEVYEETLQEMINPENDGRKEEE